MVVYQFTNPFWVAQFWPTAQEAELVDVNCVCPTARLGGHKHRNDFSQMAFVNQQRVDRKNTFSRDTCCASVVVRCPWIYDRHQYQESEIPMHLTVGFDSGLIEDRSYPPLHVGQVVNLSFQVEVTSPLLKADEPTGFQVANDAECVFVGEVLRIYRQPTELPLAVLQAGDFLFYVEGDNVIRFDVGDRISGAGSLVIDYYIWVEFINDYENPPNLFFTMRVERLREVKIRTLPPMVLWRKASMSSRLCGERYQDSDVQDVTSMEQRGSEFRFYLVDLDDQSLPPGEVLKTFLGSTPADARQPHR